MHPNAIVIIGAGHAGFHTAAFLRQAGFSGRIQLLNGEPSLPYQRPPLSKGFLKDGRRDGLFFRNQTFFEEHRVDLVQVWATGIDRANRVVRTTSDRELSYDHLVLATGANNRTLTIPDAGADLAYIKDLDDAERLRQRLEAVGRAVVIGAGFIGLEFAATACAKGIEVNVVDVASRCMQRLTTPQVSAYFEDRHRKRGVSFYFDTGIVRIHRDRGKIQAIDLSDGRTIKTDLIVAGIGVFPNCELASDSGLLVRDGIVVDDYLVSSDRDISAIGDCAIFPTPYAKGLVRLESVQNATEQARCVASRLTGNPRVFSSVPWFWSDQGPDKLQIVGLASGCDRTIARGAADSDSFSIFCYCEGKLICVESVNRPGDHIVARKLMSSGRSISAIEAADINVDLKMLLS